MTDVNWADAACADDQDSDRWFPTSSSDVDVLREICRGCPIVRGCFDAAMLEGPQSGMRGGLSARQRQRIRAGKTTYEHEWERFEQRRLRPPRPVAAAREYATDDDWKLARQIIRDVAQRHDTTPSRVRGRDGRSTSAVRAEAMARVYRETRLSYPQVGELFDCRDHTTVMSAVRRHDERKAA